jgi:hypothetical protein
MSFRGYRRLTTAVLLPLLLVLARGGSAQDVTIGPTPTQGETSPGGAVYTDPVYGWSLAYDASWTAIEEGPERLVLTNGVSTFTFASTTEYGDDADACLAGAADSLAADARNTDVMPATTENGGPVRGEDAAAKRVWAVYLLTRDGNGLAVYLDCRQLLRGEAVLSIAQETAVGAFNGENEPRQELLAGLTLPVDRCGTALAYRDASLGGPTEAVPLEEQATAAPATMTADCGGPPATTTPVSTVEVRPARRVTPEGGAQIWSCPPDERSDYCVTATEPAR